MLGSVSTISVSEKTRDDVFQQLNNLIGNQVKITSYCYKQLKPGGNFKDDLVLITMSLIKDRVLPLLAPDCNYICAKRNLNLENIHLLLEIPEGSQVLVVNELYENALEVIDELEALGFNHFQFYPHNSAEPLTHKFHYAITIGAMKPTLANVDHVIHLGPRQINLLTVAEILHFFTNEIIVDELITSRYVKPSVQSVLKLNKEIKKNNALRAQMAAIIEGFDDGILILEGDLEVGFYNKTAQKILQWDLATGELPEWLKTALRNKENETFFLQNNSNDLQIEVRKIDNSSRPAQLVIIKDIALLRRIDIDYRTYQKNLGNRAVYFFKDIIHADENMRQVVEAAKVMADSLSNVLITGESGTGKEIMAQAIHNASPCAQGPFVAINCGAISESLLESELFGYDEGAFTGASKKGKIGLIELANNGTLFLDEIGDAPLSIQQKMLRVIQEKSILRVAGRQPINVNVRIIAGTNQDLPTLVAEKKFRIDLYYRLNVLSVHIPSLRSRRKDIPLLFNSFLKSHLADCGKIMPKVNGVIYDSLSAYEWPGNIRELENLCEYLANYIIHDKDPNLLAKIEGYKASQKRECRANTEAEKLIHYKLETLENEWGLDDQAMSKESLIILEVLYHLTREGYLISQKKILESCHYRGRDYTAYRLKLILSGLQTRGLVETVVGRGTSLTEAGLNYLRKIYVQTAARL